MSTGTPGGTYDVLGQRYRAILARSGVVLRLLPSAGGVDTLARMHDPRSGVTAAFAQSGLTSEEQSPELGSLGTLFYEPFWLFYRGADPGARLEGLRGKSWGAWKSAPIACAYREHLRPSSIRCAPTSDWYATG